MKEMLFCTNKNLHFTVRLEHNPPHVMLWADMIADQLTGLFFGWICWHCISCRNVAWEQWMPVPLLFTNHCRNSSVQTLIPW